MKVKSVYKNSPCLFRTKTNSMDDGPRLLPWHLHRWIKGLGPELEKL